MCRVFMIISISLCWSVVASQYDNNDEQVTGEVENNEDIYFRVVNGKHATLGEFPYQISLKRYHQSSYTNFCGGSLIGLSKILTAGHCLTYQKNICEKWCAIYRIRHLSKIYAVAGTLRTIGYYTDDPNSPEQWRKLQKAVVAKGYDFPKRDICLAFTTTPFVVTQYVNILPVASQAMDYGSMECIASGYGRINYRITSDSLLWAHLQLIPMSQCSLLHERNMKDFICTSAHHTNVLQGDSGGGLVCKNTGDPNDKGQGVIVGVVSGAVVRRGKYKTFFTRVTSYENFIQNIATLNLPVFYIVWLLTIISRLN